MQRRHHYEAAFEEYLRGRRLAYVAVDEARKTLLPAARCDRGGGGGAGAGGRGEDLGRELVGGPLGSATPLKSFDCVVYTPGGSRLIDVKGRKVNARHGSLGAGRGGRGPFGSLQTWVTREDVEALALWQRLFGPGFVAVFAFVYWCEAQPPDGLFHEVIDYRDRWYCVRCVTLADYVRVMQPRSERWGTVHVPSGEFWRISTPLVGTGIGTA